MREDLSPKQVKVMFEILDAQRRLEQSEAEVARAREDMDTLERLASKVEFTTEEMDWLFQYASEHMIEDPS